MLIETSAVNRSVRRTAVRPASGLARAVALAAGSILALHPGVQAAPVGQRIDDYIAADYSELGIDLDRDGRNDLTFWPSGSGFYVECAPHARVADEPVAGTEFRSPSRFEAGQSISGSQSWASFAELPAFNYDDWTTIGPWASPGPQGGTGVAGYLGVKLSAADGDHYAWIALTVGADGSFLYVQASAVESVPGDAIAAGAGWPAEPGCEAFRYSTSDTVVNLGAQWSIYQYLHRRPTSIRWYKDGVIIPGANFDYVGGFNANAADGGVYTFVATTCDGVSVTRSTTLVVRDNCQATRSPAGDLCLETGPNGGVEAAHDPALNAFPVTVEAWVNTTFTGQFPGIINKYLSSSRNGYNLYMIGGVPRAWYFKDYDNYVYDNGNGLWGRFIADGRWHHVALVVDEAGGRLYVDGTYTDGLGWTGTPGPCTTELPLRVGFYPGPNSQQYLPGQIDEVRIWNVARTGEQIAASAAGVVDPASPGLLAYYRFDSAASAGATVSDLTGNGFNATVQAGARVFDPGAGPGALTPTILSQPADYRGPSDRPVTLTANVTFVTPIVRRWQWRMPGGEFVDVGDAPYLTGRFASVRVDGARTGTLTLTPSGQGLATLNSAQFRLAATAPCSTVTTRAATLTIACNPADIAGAGATYDNGAADIGPDQQLTIEDFLIFLSAFGDAAGCPGATPGLGPCNPADIAGSGATYTNGTVDVGPDGELSIEDFLIFLSAFSDGARCP